MRRRQIGCKAAALAALLPIALLVSGCGGGGGGGTGAGAGPTSTPTVLSNSAVVLPTDGSVQISNVTSDSVTLTGNVPNLQTGTILASTAGNGLLRKVTSVTKSARSAGGRQSTSTVVTTTQATLEDYIQQTDVSVSKDLNASDFNAFVPKTQGVRAVTVAGSGSGSRRRAAGDITISLNKVALHGDSSAPDVYVDGSLVIHPSLDIALRMDSFTIRKFSFVPKLTASPTVSLTAKGAGSVSVSKEIMELDGNPILVGYIVVVPVFHVFVAASGSVEAGVSFQAGGSASVTAGIQYDPNAGGWSLVSGVDSQLNLSAMPNVYATATAELDVPKLELTASIMDVAGPHLTVDIPYGKLEYTAQTSPRQVHVVGSVGFKGSVGADITILGHVVATTDLTLVEKDFTLFDKTFSEPSGTGGVAGTIE